MQDVSPASRESPRCSVCPTSPLLFLMQQVPDAVCGGSGGRDGRVAGGESASGSNGSGSGPETGRRGRSAARGPEPGSTPAPVVSSAGTAAGGATITATAESTGNLLWRGNHGRALSRREASLLRRQDRSSSFAGGLGATAAAAAGGGGGGNGRSSARRTSSLEPVGAAPNLGRPPRTAVAVNGAAVGMNASAGMSRSVNDHGGSIAGGLADGGRAGGGGGASGGSEGTSVLAGRRSGTVAFSDDTDRQLPFPFAVGSGAIAAAAAGGVGQGDDRTVVGRTSSLGPAAATANLGHSGRIAGAASVGAAHACVGAGGRMLDNQNCSSTNQNSSSSSSPVAALANHHKSRTSFNGGAGGGGGGGRTVGGESRGSGTSTSTAFRPESNRRSHAAVQKPEVAPGSSLFAARASAATADAAGRAAAAESNERLRSSGSSDFVQPPGSAVHQPLKRRSSSVPCAKDSRATAAATASGGGVGGGWSAGRTSLLRSAAAAADVGRPTVIGIDTTAAGAAHLSDYAGARMDHRGDGDARSERLAGGGWAGGWSGTRGAKERTSVLSGQRSGTAAPTDGMSYKPKRRACPAGKTGMPQRPPARTQRRERHHRSLEMTETSRGVRTSTASSLPNLPPPPPPPPLPPAKPPALTSATAPAKDDKEEERRQQESFQEDGDGSAPGSTGDDTAGVGGNGKKRRMESGVQGSRAGGGAGGCARKAGSGDASSNECLLGRLGFRAITGRKAAKKRSAVEEERTASKSEISELQATALRAREEWDGALFTKVSFCFARFVFCSFFALRRFRGRHVWMTLGAQYAIGRMQIRFLVLRGYLTFFFWATNKTFSRTLWR